MTDTTRLTQTGFERMDTRQLDWREDSLGSEARIVSWFDAETELTKIQTNGFLYSALPDLPPVPRPELLDNVSRYRGELSQLIDARIAFIGGGAGSIMLASYLSMRGASSYNMHIFDRQTPYGGIWHSEDVQVGGFNNPAPLVFNNHHSLGTEDRSGKRMFRFLNNIAEDYLYASGYTQECVEKLDFDRRSRHWQVITEAGKKVTADFVVVAAGQPYPKKLDGPRISSNLDRLEAQNTPGLKLEHHQRKLRPEELAEGAPPIVLIGLGNSTAAMIQQIQRYEDEHNVEVDYTVLTDASEEAILHPTYFALGVQDKPIFRDPDNGYLTGYSGDLPRDRRSFVRAREEGRIITDVRIVVFNKYRKQLEVDTLYSDTRSFESPNIFSLIGFERDPRLFDAAKCLVKKVAGDGVSIRASDGAVLRRKGGYETGIFAIGSCATQPKNLNAAVIPGIFGQIPATALSMAMLAGHREVTRR